MKSTFKFFKKVITIYCKLVNQVFDKIDINIYNIIDRGKLQLLCQHCSVNRKGKTACSSHKDQYLAMLRLRDGEKHVRSSRTLTSNEINV